MYRSLSLLLTLALMGCPSADKSSDIDSGESDAAGFAPQEGTWEGGEFVYDDACELGLADDDDDDSIASTLTMDADGGGFTITEAGDDEDDDAIICTLDGMSFVCDNGETEETDFAEHGYDAVMTVDQSVGGEFFSETEAELRMEIDINCEGADCAEVAELTEIDMPCTSLMSVPLTAD